MPRAIAEARSGSSSRRAASRPVVSSRFHEWRGGAAIAYSLGNFMFVNRDPDKRSAGILQAHLTRGADGRPQLVSLALTPTVTALATFAPAPARGRDAERIATLMTKRSGRWQTRVVQTGDTLVFEPGQAPALVGH